MTSLPEFIAIIKAEFPEDRLTYQKSIPTFHPESAAEAARFLQLVNRHRRTTFITGFGNNLDPVGERFADMVTIRTDRLNQLCEVAKEDFYVRVGAGYPLMELRYALAPYGLFLPHAQLPYVGSVGGAIAVDLSAGHDRHVLPIRRYLVQAEIVTPQGEIVKPGSPAFKSVSGYDVVKIFSPSWGLLGLLVTVVFRVLPESARGEYADLRMQAVRRDLFLSGLDETDSSADAVYSRKIKAKFDPQGVLPIV